MKLNVDNLQFIFMKQNKKMLIKEILAKKVIFKKKFADLTNFDSYKNFSKVKFLLWAAIKSPNLENTHYIKGLGRSYDCTIFI